MPEFFLYLLFFFLRFCEHGCARGSVKALAIKIRVTTPNQSEPRNTSVFPPTRNTGTLLTVAKQLPLPLSSGILFFRQPPRPKVKKAEPRVVWPTDTPRPSHRQHAVAQTRQSRRRRRSSSARTARADLAAQRFTGLAIAPALAKGPTSRKS